MTSSRRIRFVSTTTAVLRTTNNGETNSPGKTIEIPIQSPEIPVPIPVHFTYSGVSPESAAAVKIQSVYRAHLVRTLVRAIAAVKSEVDRFEIRLRQQETVDLIRRDEKARLKLNEQLMAMLLKLDSVRGMFPAVREFRRSVSRRIVGLQEILDAVSGAGIEGPEFFPASWEEIVAGIEQGCGGRDGGEEDEFECRALERFLGVFDI